MNAIVSPVSPSIHLYDQLLAIGRQLQYNGRPIEMDVDPADDLSYMKKRNYALQSIQVKYTDNPDENPVIYRSNEVSTIDFSWATWICMHWRMSKCSKISPDGEDLRDIYARKENKKWVRINRYSSIDLTTIERDMPLLTQETYQRLMDGRRDRQFANHFFNELRRLVRSMSDERNHFVNSENLAHGIHNSIELEAYSIDWANRHQVTSTDINGNDRYDFH